MPKIQKIERRNGSYVYSVNLPLEIIEYLDWQKGQELDAVESGGMIILSKKDDELKEEEASKN